MTLFGRSIFSVVLILLLSSCAGDAAHREGLDLLAAGKPEEGLAKLEQATREAPDSVPFRSDLLTRRAEQVSRLLSVADTERSTGRLDNAEALYRSVLKIEPRNSRATVGLDAIARDRRHVPMIGAASEMFKKGDAEGALRVLTPVLIENPDDADAVNLKREIEAQQTAAQVTEPVLRTNQKKPISLEFRDANLKIVFESLARSTNVNFILDKDVRPDLRITVFLRQASLEDAIDLILQTNQLEKKVLNKNTILIYPNTPEKLKEYKELVVKGFYLANADVKQTQAMLKSMLKTKDIFIDEKTNLLMMRDTPDAIRLAEKMIAMQDLYEPEVMLEVEVLEVQRSRLLALGVQWSSQMTLTVLPTSSVPVLRDLKNINDGRIGATMPSAVINLQHDLGDSNILANPRIRVRNREKAKIMIGDKLPVSTSTTTATGVISESVQYLDVGIKLEVEPNISLRDEVAIKVGLEVSSVTNEVHTPGGSLAYQIGSRAANTVLSLKDGETQVLAGLINDQDRSTANRVPGLGDIPLLGRLFGTQKDDHNKTEIVLSITPHLIRNLRRPDAVNSHFWSGTDSSLRTKPLSVQYVQATESVIPDAKQNPLVKNDSKPDADGDAPEGSIKAPTMIALNWQGPKQVKPGEQFKVALKMKSDGGVRSLPIQLGFDPAVLQVMEVTEGAFFKQNEARTSLSSNVDAVAGKVFASVVRSGNDGAIGEGDVIILTLRALTAKSPSEIRVLSSAPVSMGDKALTPILPPPYVINIAN